MARYICNKCSNVYDEANGDPWSGIKPNTEFAQLPKDWVCSDCGAKKRSFVKITNQEKILGNFFNIIEM